MAEAVSAEDSAETEAAEEAVVDSVIEAEEAAEAASAVAIEAAEVDSTPTKDSLSPAKINQSNFERIKHIPN